jgi:hypothetical protein
MEPKKSRQRGRPAIGEGIKLGLRIRPDLDCEIENWIADKGDPKLTKPEAIRQLLWKALKG